MKPGASQVMFGDRVDAGRVLAERLWEYAGLHDVLVLGLPRGGVPVAAEVAERLSAPLGICLVRKLGVPGHAEFAMGAIASGGVVEVDEALVRKLHIALPAVLNVVRTERAELERREFVYRGDRAPERVTGKTVIVVDDGMATGATMRAVVSSLRGQSPARIVVAVPVASRQACEDMQRHADACICLACPEPFRAVGLFYANFAPTSDSEVIGCLSRMQLRHESGAAHARRESIDGASG